MLDKIAELGRENHTLRQELAAARALLRKAVDEKNNGWPNGLFFWESWADEAARAAGGGE